MSDKSNLEIAHGLESIRLQEDRHTMFARAAEMLENSALLDVPRVAHGVKRSTFEPTPRVDSKIVKFLNIVGFLRDEPTKDFHALSVMPLSM